MAVEVLEDRPGVVRRRNAAFGLVVTALVAAIVASTPLLVGAGDAPEDGQLQTGGAAAAELCVPGACGVLTGSVDTATFGPTAGAEVQVCPALEAITGVGSGCVVVLTDSIGGFRVEGLEPGRYELEAWPPPDPPDGYPAEVSPASVHDATVVRDGTTAEVHIVLEAG